MSPQSKEGQKQRRNEEIDWKIRKNGGERIFVTNIKETKAGEKAGSIIDAQIAEKATVDKIRDVEL